MSHSRRAFLRRGAFLGAAIGAGKTAVAAVQQEQHQHHTAPPAPQPKPRTPQAPARVEATRFAPAGGVVMPDIPKLPYKLDGATKVFHLIAEPVKRKIVPFKTMDVWGYNGSCPGPLIEVNEGDRVRIEFENRLPESTTVHWHGLEVPIEMDGVPYISQPPVPPGGKFTYEFTLQQNGTFFYHSHGAMQEMMGMIGMFVIHPKKAHTPVVHHDFGIILQGWAILPNNSVPNTSNMEFNWLTFNGVSSPATTPMLVRQGSRVRLRLVNLGMDHHPIHLHGHQFYITGNEGGRAPESTWYPTNTVLVGVAQARDIEFDAKYIGDWMVHCHLPHHMMNSMSDLMMDRMITTAATNETQALSQMQTMADSNQFRHIHHAPIAKDAQSVPGFPQDAFMEMAMDELVAKPENHGLPQNWSASMMGMMTMVRVLPEKQYDEIMAMKTAPAAEHKHE